MEQFLEQLAPTEIEQSYIKEAIISELDSYAHKVMLDAKPTAKSALIEMMKLQNCYATG